MSHSESLRRAATVLVLRPGPAGREVLLLKRSGRSGFFPDAWVFPGGRVEDGDAAVPVLGSVAGLHDEPHWAVAAIRETFEEAGIWLGEGTPAPGLRERLVQRTGSLVPSDGLVANLERVRFVAWWITPEAEPRRYDTRFFLAFVDAAEVAHATPCTVETVESQWLTPSEACRLQGEGSLFLAPPTLRVLEDLALVVDTSAVFSLPPPSVGILPRIEGGLANPAAAGSRPQDGLQIVLPGDPTYPSAHPVAGPTRIVLRGRIWRSEDAPADCGNRE